MAGASAMTTTATAGELAAHARRARAGHRARAWARRRSATSGRKSRASWRRTLTVVAVDLPGHGAAPAETKLDANQIAARIVATADAEKLGPAILVGHSLGGFIVAHAAGKAHAIAIVDMGVGKMWTQKEIDELRAGIKKDRTGTLKSFAAGICMPDQFDKLMPGLLALSDETLFGYLQMMATQPTPPEKLRNNVMLMASQLMLTGKRTQAEELATLGFGDARGLRVERFTASKHWLFWDEPQKFLTTLVEFAHAVGN